MEEPEVIVNRALERHTLLRRFGLFRRPIFALLTPIPLWLILGIVLAVLRK